jgi:hypothetical protein
VNPTRSSPPFTIGRRAITRQNSSSSSIGISVLHRQHQSIFIDESILLACLCESKTHATVEISREHSLTPEEREGKAQAVFDNNPCERECADVKFLKRS